MEAEFEVMVPKAVEHIGPSDAERGKERLSLTALRGSVVILYLDF